MSSPEQSQPPPQHAVTPAQRAVLEEENAATDEDASSLIPALLVVLGAYATYRAAKGPIKGSWTAWVKQLKLQWLVGGQMMAIAERALARQRSRNTRGGGQSLLPYASAATVTSYDSQMQALAHHLQYYQRHPDVDLPNVANPPQNMAEQIAVVGRNTAQMDAEIRSFTDPDKPQVGSLHKNWLSLNDSHVRTSHQWLGSPRYESHSVPISAPFRTISGALMNYPGDASLGAPLDELINCRCTLIYSKSSSFDPDAPQYLPAYWIKKRRGEQPHDEQARRDAEDARRAADAARREAIYLEKFGSAPASV